MLARIPQLPSGDPWCLRCHECERAVELSSADALEHAVTEWPRCCGQVMWLSAEVAIPASNPQPYRSLVAL